MENQKTSQTENGKLWERFSVLDRAELVNMILKLEKENKELNNLNLTDFPNTTINDYREAYEDVMFEYYDMDGKYFDDFMSEHEDELANFIMNDGSINLVPAVLKFHGNEDLTIA